MGFVDRFECLNNRELLYDFANVFATSHTRRINEGVGLIMALIPNVNAISGSSGLIKYDHPLFPEQPVDQGRFTDIRTPHYGNTNTRVVEYIGGSCGRQSLNDSVY